MSLLNFMQQKAEEKGITTCPNCGTPDIFYSFFGKCSECDTPFEEKPKIKKLQFSIEVLTEFTEKYDEFMPADIKKIFVQIGKAIIHKIKTTNTVDNSKLIQFQYQCNHIPQLGSNSFGGAIDGTKMGIQMVESAPNAMEVGKSLASVLFAIQYIRAYKVPNEFILETSPSQSKPVQKEIRQPVPKSSKSGGCLGVFLTLTLITTFIIVLIFVS